MAAARSTAASPREPTPIFQPNGFVFQAMLGDTPTLNTSHGVLGLLMRPPSIPQPPSLVTLRDSSCCGSRFLDNRVIMLKGSLFISSTSSISRNPQRHSNLPLQRAGWSGPPTCIKTTTTRDQSDISAHHPGLYNIYQYLLFLLLL